MYSVKFVNSDKELVTAKTIASNRVDAVSNIKISFDVIEIVEVI